MLLCLAIHSLFGFGCGFGIRLPLVVQLGMEFLSIIDDSIFRLVRKLIPSDLVFGRKFSKVSLDSLGLAYPPR